MKILAAIMTMVLLALSVQPAWASAGGPVKVLTVYDNGRAIISLSNPDPFTREDIEVESAGSQLEVLAQLELAAGQRLLLVSELDHLIVTALSTGGVAGRPLLGGYELRAAQGEATVLRLSGTLPPGKGPTTLLDITLEDASGIRTLLSITVSPKPPPGILATVWAIVSPWGLVGIVLVAAGIFLWRKLRRRTSFWEEMDR